MVYLKHLDELASFLVPHVDDVLALLRLVTGVPRS